MRVSLTDSREISMPFFIFHAYTSKSQRASYTISGGSSGLHWGEIYRDINVESLILVLGDRKNPSTRKGP